jgi:hypothetical protein
MAFLSSGSMSSPRRDGIIIQLNRQVDATGWNDPNEQPDQAEAVTAVRRLADLSWPPSTPRQMAFSMALRRHTFSTCTF